MLVLTLGADIKISWAHPVFTMTTFCTDKAIWPFLFEQIFVTGFWVWKPFIKFNFVFRKIFSDRKVCHSSLLFKLWGCYNTAVCQIRTNYELTGAFQISALIYYEACLSQKDATKREKYLKTYNGRRFLHKRLKSYLTG